MKHLALLLLTFAGFALQGCSDGPEPRPPVKNPPAASSSSSVAAKPNMARGEAFIKGQKCSFCHEDQGLGVFSGPNPFNVNDLEHVAKTTDINQFTSDLAQYIEAEMPVNVPSACDELCAADVALYLASFYITGGASSVSVSSSSSSDAASSESSDAATSSSDMSSSSSDAISSVASSSSSSVVVVLPSSSSSASAVSSDSGLSSEPSVSSVPSSSSASSVSSVMSSSSVSSVMSSSSVSSDSSSAESSSSVAQEKGDPLSGAAIMESVDCAGCHAEMPDGSYALINVDKFAYPLNEKYENKYFADSEADLAEFIEDNMPLVPSLCVGQCALDAAAYLWSMRADAGSSSSDASSSSSADTSSSVVSSSSVATSSSEDTSSSSSEAASSSSVIVVPSSSVATSESSSSAVSSASSEVSSVVSSSSVVVVSSSSSSEVSSTSSSEASSSVDSSSSSNVVSSSSAEQSSSSSVSSSVVVSSSSESALPGDPVAGAGILAETRCSLCHTQESDGTFTPYAINVNNFAYPSDPKYAGYLADTEADLAHFIEDNMPTTADVCDGQCALDAAAYLWSLRDEPASSSSSAAVSSSSDAVSSSSAPMSSSSSSDVVSSPSSEVSSSSEASMSSSSSLAPLPEFMGSLTGGLVLTGTGADILQQLLAAIGADSYADFEAALDASPFNDDGEVDNVFSGLGQVFGSVADSLESLVTGSNGEYSFGGITVIRSGTPAKANLVFTVSDSAILDGCNLGTNSCSVAVTGAMTIELSSFGQSNGKLFIGSVVIDIDSLRAFNAYANMELSGQAGLSNVDYRAEPFTLGDEYPLGIETLDLSFSAENSNVVVNGALNGTAADIEVSQDADILTVKIGDANLSAMAMLSGSGVTPPQSSSSVSNTSVSSSSIASSSESSQVSSSSSSSAVISSSSSSTPISSSSSVTVSSSSVSSVAGSSQFDGRLTGELTLNGTGTELFEQLLAAIGADEYAAFQAAMDASAFNKDGELSNVLAGLGVVFGSVSDSLESLVTGTNGQYNFGGIAVVRSGTPARAVLEFTIADTANLVDCTAGVASCQVGVAGALTIEMSSFGQSNGKLFIGLVDIDIASLSASNDFASIEVGGQVGLADVDYRADPLTVGDEYPLGLTSVSLQLKAENAGSTVVGNLTGSASGIQVSGSTTVVIGDSDLSLSLSLTGSGVGIGSSSSSVVVSSSSMAVSSSSTPVSSSSASISSSSVASSSSSVTVSSSSVAAVGQFDGALDGPLALNGNSEEMIQQVLAAIGQAEFDAFSANLDASPYDSGQLSYMMSGIGSVLSGLSSSLQQLVTGANGTYNFDGVTVVRTGTPAAANLSFTLDKSVTDANCVGGNSVCQVQVAGQFTAAMRDFGQTATGVYIGTVDLSIANLTASTGVANMALSGVASLGPVDYVPDPLTIGVDYPLILNSIDISMTSVSNGAALDATISGNADNIVLNADGGVSISDAGLNILLDLK